MQNCLAQVVPAEATANRLICLSDSPNQIRGSHRTSARTRHNASHELRRLTRKRFVFDIIVRSMQEITDACPLGGLLRAATDCLHSYKTVVWTTAACSCCGKLSMPVLCTERLDVNDPAEARLSRGRILQQTTVSTSFPSVSAVASRISVIEVHH